MSENASQPSPDDMRSPRGKGASFFRLVRRSLPTGLYARSLLIVIIPMVLLQSVVAAVFMERHWQLVTTRLSAALVRDIAAIIELVEDSPASADRDRIIEIARNSLGLDIAFDPPGELPMIRPAPLFSILDPTLAEEISTRIRRPFYFNVTPDRTVEIRIKLNDMNLRLITPVSRTYASNTHIFLFWMIGTALVLLAISILFLRGQIRPILALAEAAEQFGKGQRPAEPFVPRGADEVRRAGYAFLQMRERIERQMEQRTAMLSGVSHDLRTILTRFRLQLAIAEDAKDLESLNRDIEDMQSMLEGYLAFAKGETEEDVGKLDLRGLVERLASEAATKGKNLVAHLDDVREISVRPNAFSRLITNLVTNAWRHAGNIAVDAKISARWLTIHVDDDGPGIPEHLREDVFKPFFRLDEARNLDASGTGLGLAIARDIARGHGGNVTLSDSPMGGLRATVRVPV